jgi:peptide/nickel transport system substrate-binding protein
MAHRLNRLTRRQFTVMVLGTATAALLSEACGPAAQPAATPSGAGAAAPTAPPQAASTAPPQAAAAPTAAKVAATATAPAVAKPSGGSLVYARNMDTKTLDPHFSTQLSERYALYLIYNTLVAYDKDFNIGPDLAASWDIADGGKSITFHLQPGVKFHDGTDCDAAAVKWNLERILDPSVKSPLVGQLQPPLEKVDLVDKTTVKLQTSIPWRPLLAALGERPGFIVSPTAAQKSGQDFGRTPVGSGPFKFVEWVPDSHITVERFADYWDKGQQRLDRIDIRHVPDTQVQLGMIRTGEAHLIDSVAASALSTLQGAQGVATEELKSGRFWGTQSHSDIPPFDNVDLRKAVAYATDREAVRRVAFQETGRLATHPLGGGWAYNAQLDTEGYALDLDKAKEALAQSGYAGQPLTFTNSNDRLTQNIAQILQATYTKAGLNVSLESVPAADSFTRVKEGKTNWTTTNWAPRADPDGLLRILWHSTGFQNSTKFSDPEVDRLLDQAAGLFDNKQAAAIYIEVERKVVQEASYTFMIWPSEFAARRTNVQGFVYYPDLILRLRDLSLG